MPENDIACNATPHLIAVTSETALDAAIAIDRYLEMWDESGGADPLWDPLYALLARLEEVAQS